MLADLTRFQVGSDVLKSSPFYIKSFPIPGISLNHISMATRSGIRAKFGSDSLEYGDLDLEVILDSNLDSYFELLDLVYQEVDFDYDSFAQPTFDLWVVALDSQGNELLKFDFIGCKINSLGSLNLDAEAELGATVSVSITFEMLRWKRNKITSDCDGNKQICEQTVERWYKNAPKYEDFVKN